jgi:hypothetical protein
MKEYFLFTVGSVCRVKFNLGDKHFADDEEVETEARKWLRQLLCCGFRRTGKVMGQVYHCWWRICREINFFFQFGISHILRFISICDVFTDSPSYIRSPGRYLKPRPPECEAGVSITRPWCFIPLSAMLQKTWWLKVPPLFYTKFRMKWYDGARS